MSHQGYALDGAAILSAAAASIAALPPGAPITRVVVLGDTGSTQDDARTLCEGQPGLVVFAEHQTRGRGRLGRQWADISMKSLPATFVVSPGLAPSRLSLAAGLAACHAVESFLPEPRRVGIRWPNDVVERQGRTPGVPGRKLAGVLIEASEGLHLVGIGINVRHTSRDWPEPLRSTACSLKQLGTDVERAQVAAALIASLARCLAADESALVAAWRERNVLLGQHCAFVHDGHAHHGIVRDIDPANHIVLETEGGRTVHLPALTTSMIK